MSPSTISLKFKNDSPVSCPLVIQSTSFLNHLRELNVKLSAIILPLRIILYFAVLCKAPSST